MASSVVSFKIQPLLLFAFVVVMGFTVSCGPAALKGRILLSGSATLAPLISKAIEPWKKLNPGVEVRIDVIGSDAGLEQLIRYNETDLALISRPLSDGDRESASSVGQTLIPVPLAWDAVCLVVPISNTWVLSLGRNQTALAFTSAKLWSDLDASWPAKPIHRFVLGPNSGTADVLAAGIFPDGTKSRLFSASEAQATEDDRILARGVAQVGGAIGYLGWSTAQEYSGSLRMVAFEGTAPSSTSIANHTYALRRRLSLVATKQSLIENAALQSLVIFLYQHYSSLSTLTGLVPLSAEEIQAAERTLNELRIP